MGRKQLHIMAIGAHIGDAELTCGKVLAKHSLMGDKITIVALTAGEKGAPPSIPVNKFKQMNIDSAKEFARMLKGQSLILDYRDGELPEDEKIKLEVCDIIRKHQPDVLLTHWKNSIHKDHITAHRLVTDAWFYASLRTLEREMPAHLAKGPYYAENWEDSDQFQPYIYVDVTEGFELWEKAVTCFWLATNSPHFKYLEYYDALSKARGILIGKQRAEVYAVDPSQMKQVLNSF